MLDIRVWYDFIQLMRGEFRNLCRDSILDSPELMEMIEKQVKVDAVITLSSCGAFMAHLFDAPLIMFSTNGAMSIMLDPKHIHGTSTRYKLNPFVNTLVKMYQTLKPY